MVAAYKTSIGYAQLRNGVFEKKVRVDTVNPNPNPNPNPDPNPDPNPNPNPNPIPHQESYYNRMAGYVLLLAATVQTASVPLLTSPYPYPSP